MRARDVLVKAPPAIHRLGGTDLPATPEMLLAERDVEREERRAQETAASTLANVASVLATIAAESGLAIDASGSILIPRSLVRRMEGAKITLSETPDGDVVVGVRERGPDLRVNEGS